MNVLPLVSVVIPCYNHEQFVQDCIQSVIDQTYKNIELIIIDDGSKDRSVEKIKEMIPVCKERFTRFEFRYRLNRGLSATLNEALEWCRGEYFSALASDDIIVENKIKTQVTYLTYNLNCIAVFGGIIEIDTNGLQLGSRIRKISSYTFDQIFMLEHELPAPTQMIRTKVLRDVGGYDCDIKIEDWYMWLKLAEYGELNYLPIVFAKYRSHEGNTHKQVEKMYLGRKQILNLYKNHHLFEKCNMNIEWLRNCELCLDNKKLALLSAFKLIRKHFFQLFSYNFFRFLYWFVVKSSVIK